MSETLSPEAESNPLDADYAALRETAGHYSLSDVVLFEITGDDRKAWMQGQITNDMRSLREGGSLPFCLCAPTGQLLAIGKLWSFADRYYLATDAVCREAILERAEKMIVIEDVQVVEVTSNFVGLTIQGPQATSKLGEYFEVPTLDAGLVIEDALAFRSNRTGFGGWDLWLPKGKTKLKKQVEKDFPLISEGAVEASRVEAGIPKFGTDTTQKTLPPELGTAFSMQHVSFSKGCYTGQEVLMRIHSRGHTNWQWVGLYTDGVVRAGDRVSTKSKPEAGTVTSAVDSPRYGAIATAMVRQEVAFEGEIVQIQSGDEIVEAEVRLLPFLRFD